MTKRRSSETDASAVQTGKNKCAPGFILDYDTLACVAGASERGKELQSAERRAKAVLSSDKTVKQKLFGVLKITGGVTQAYLGYLLGSMLVSKKFYKVLLAAAKQTHADAGEVAQAVAKFVAFKRGSGPAAAAASPVVVSAADTVKTLVAKTMRVLLGAGVLGGAAAAAYAKRVRRMRRSGGSSVVSGSVVSSPTPRAPVPGTPSLLSKTPTPSPARIVANTTTLARSPERTGLRHRRGGFLYPGVANAAARMHGAQTAQTVSQTSSSPRSRSPFRPSSFTDVFKNGDNLTRYTH